MGIRDLEGSACLLEGELHPVRNLVAIIASAADVIGRHYTDSYQAPPIFNKPGQIEESIPSFVPALLILGQEVPVSHAFDEIN